MKENGKDIGFDKLKLKLVESEKTRKKQAADREIRKKLQQFATIGDVAKVIMQVRRLQLIVDSDFLYSHAAIRIMMKKRWWRRILRRSLITQKEIEAEMKLINEEKTQAVKDQAKKAADERNHK